MDLIILPGNSKQFNERWLLDSQDNYSPLFNTTTIQTYKHWETGEQMADLETEVERLATSTQGKDNYIIYAKSIGTVITIKAVAENKISPKACIFVGCPFGELTGQYKEFSDWIKKYSIHTLFIQQTNDPFFKYTELEKFIDDSGIQNYELVEIDGDNHAYDNYDYIKQLMKDFAI
uniref:Alpha/beta hydrolase n=1 Tax=candidate division WWE3 bacterium TaxID=2053526 RepID=A0A7C4XTF2_UNCKA